MKSSRTEGRSSSQIAAIKKPQHLVETTHHFKGMCEEAQQKLADLTSPSGLLHQLPTVVNEWQSLLKLKEVYEVRFFILSLESLRLNSVVAEMRGLTMDLTREKETLVEEFKLSKRKLLEDQARNLQIEFERRLEAIRHEHLKELQSLKQRSEHLQIENENQAVNLTNYTQRIQSDHSLINNLKMQIDGLERRLQQSDLAANSQKLQLKSWYDAQLKEAESRYSEELSNQQRSAADLLRQREDMFHKEKTELENLVKRYEHEVSSLRNSTQDHNLRMISLQSALGLAESKLKSRDEALNAQQLQLSQVEASCKEQYDLMKAELEEKLIKERAAKENEKREREKEIKVLRTAIDQAEARTRAAESANSQLREELAREKKVIAAQTAKIESEKTEETSRLKKEFTIIEETLREERVTLETEIWNLRSNHALEKQLLQGELEQSKSHLDKLGQELENWKREFNSFEELRTRKQAEIEQYEAKYKSYMSPEDAKQLQEDYTRAKSQAKTLEDENTSLSQSVEDHRKKIQVLEFDLASKLKRAEILEKQLQEKRRELEELEGRYHLQLNQIRGLSQTKDATENQIITLKQRLNDLDSDLKRVSSERDAAHLAYEKLDAKFSEFRNGVNHEMRQKPDDMEMVKKHSTQSNITMVRQSTKLSQSGYMSTPQGNN